MLDTFSTFPGKHHVEVASSNALKLLSVGLKLSDDFITCGRTAGASVVLTAISKLLLGINPRSGKPDHMLNIARYVLYGDWMPEARYHAIKILNYVASSPSNQPDLLATFTSSATISSSVLKAFTEALDSMDDIECGSGLPGGGGKVKVIFRRGEKLLYDFPSPDTYYYYMIDRQFIKISYFFKN